MKLVVLDRDGVINEDSDEYIKSPQEWHPIPGSLQAIAKLSRAGYWVVVATNQSGLARGLFDIKTLMKIHDKMIKAVEAEGGTISSIFYCPHGPDDHCNCRKPKPGLLQDIANRLRVDLADVPVVGDSLRDLQAAQTIGAKPILVLTGRGHALCEKAKQEITGLAVFENLLEFVEKGLPKESGDATE